MSFSDEDIGEHNVSFGRFVLDLRNVMRIDLGWPAEEIDEMLADPMSLKSFWIEEWAPLQVVRHLWPRRHAATDITRPPNPKAPKRPQQNKLMRRVMAASFPNFWTPS